MVIFHSYVNVYQRVMGDVKHYLTIKFDDWFGRLPLTGAW